MRRFIGRGDVVLVKPNIGWDRTPEQAAGSHQKSEDTIEPIGISAKVLNSGGRSRTRLISSSAIM